MRIAIALIGTRGDIQPGIAFGIELKSRGHDVVVSAPKSLEDLAAKSGLAVVPLEWEHDDAIELKGLSASAQSSPLGTIRQTIEKAKEKRKQTILSLMGLCQGADLIVTTSQAEQICDAISRKWGIPIAGMHFYPHRENSFFPPPGLAPKKELSPRECHFYWSIFDTFWSVMVRLLLGKAIQSILGSVEMDSRAPRSFARRGAVEFQTYFDELLPGLAEEWDERRPFVGPLRLPSATRELLGESIGQYRGLDTWLDAGDPPIFFGFGSIPNGKDEFETVEMVEELCEQLGQRAIVNFNSHQKALQFPRGTGGRVYVTGPIAHDLVFPRCRAAVVHGGVGTVNETFLAGIPVLVCWVDFDQPYWGMAAKRAGVGDYVKFSRLDGTELKRRVAGLLEPNISENARNLGERLRKKEEGVRRMSDMIESRLGVRG